MSIQIDNGEFTRLHNDILANLAMARLSASEYRCLLFLFRMTYGWQKKEDAISLSQWATGIGLDAKTDRGNVWLLLQELVRKNVLYTKSNGNNKPATWGFNKNFEQWDETVMSQHSSDEPTVMSQHNTTAMPGHNSTAIPEHSKTAMSQHNHKRKKETIKETIKEKKEDAASAAPPNDETWVAFLEAFCWVCHGHKDIGALTKEEKGALTSEAKKVRDKGYTIDDLRDWFRDVWQKDWRWTKNKQHERPRPADVRSMIPILRDTEPSTSGYRVDIPDVEFMPGIHPLQPAPNGHSPPPLPHDDPWAIALPELLQTLSGSAPLWLAGSRLESNGELAEVPFYRLIVMQPGADTGWLTRQAGPTIRRKLANILRKPIELDIVHESRLTP